MTQARSLGATLVQASAPGKIILFGEHAVVYGRPAIAVPVTQAMATATITTGVQGSGLILELPDVGEELRIDEASADHPLARVVHMTLNALGLITEPAWILTVHSSIPMASGMGSGAAAATAIVRALAKAAGVSLKATQVSALVYESERLFHGTPSGIDNTVVAYQQPIWYVRGQPPQPFAIGRPFTIVIADTGIASPTSATVGDVRQAWEKDPAGYENLFDRVGAVAHAARRAIEAGHVDALGPLMDDNHRLLQAIGVSCPELDALQEAAKSAGALGAKLSGGGRGGNLIALGPDDGLRSRRVADALIRHGAVTVLMTSVQQEFQHDPA